MDLSSAASMRSSCVASLSLDALNNCTAAPKASPRLATSTALPVTWAEISASLPVSDSTRSENCAPTRSISSEVVPTSASTAARCSVEARLTASSRVASVSSRRPRSSSMALSWAKLSDSF